MQGTPPLPLTTPIASVIPQQYRSHSSTPVHSGGKGTSSARFQTPPRPKSAAVRRTDAITTPPPAPATSESRGVKIVGAEGTERAKNVPDGTGGRAPSSEAALTTAGRSEFRGAEHRGGASSAGRVQHRPRPRSAVARVETTPHHGKARAGKGGVVRPILGAVSPLSSQYLVKHAMNMIPR